MSKLEKLEHLIKTILFLMENIGLFHDKLDTLHLRASLYTILKLTDTPTHQKRSLGACKESEQ